MRIKHHYCLDQRWTLKKFLDKNKISYESTQLIHGNVFLFDLYEDQDVYKKFRIQFPIASYSISSSVEFSRHEIESAQWLIVQSKSTKVQWNYTEDAFKKTCPYKRFLIKAVYYRHSEQIGLLSAEKAVRWGTRGFFSGPNAADDLLFCSEHAKNLLEDRWKGLEFWPVKKKTSGYVRDLYQLYFKKRLPIEAIVGGTHYTCKFCGKKVVRVSERDIYKLKLKKEYLEDEYTVYSTGDVFVGSCSHGETFSVYIVPQSFYQYCEKNGMNRGMVYIPIDILEED